MTLPSTARSYGVALAVLVGGCNADLLDNPTGLRCDPNRTPSCAGGFICIDEICVDPSYAIDGGPWQNTAALKPNGSQEAAATSPGVESGNGAEATPATSPDDTSAFEQTLVIEHDGPDVTVADAGDAGSAGSDDVTGNAHGSPNVDGMLDTTRDSDNASDFDNIGGPAETANPNVTGPAATIDGAGGRDTTAPANTGEAPTTTPPATSTTSPHEGQTTEAGTNTEPPTTTSPAPSTTLPSESETSDDDEPTGPAPCSVSCVAPQHGSATCEGNLCTIQCDANRDECDGDCVNTNTDMQHCGECNTMCNAPANAAPSCIAGKCDFTCHDGFDECSGGCIDTQTDVNHCGDCETHCKSNDGTPRCDRGQCKVDCPGEETYCDGACIDLTQDPENCGECGNSCLLGLCVEGECLLVL